MFLAIKKQLQNTFQVFKYPKATSIVFKELKKKKLFHFYNKKQAVKSACFNLFRTPKNTY